MGRGGTLVYRCRRCGKEVKEAHVPDAIVAVICITIGRKPEWSPLTLHMTDSHRCDSNTIGITDFIGIDLDERSSVT